MTLSISDYSPPSPSRDLTDLLACRAQTDPDGVVALLGEAALTCSEVDYQATRLATELLMRGVRPGVPVGLYMYRSLELVPAIFGILRAGGACVPLDPDDPPERREQILSHCGGKLLVSHDALPYDALAAGRDVVDVNDVRMDPGGHRESDSQNSVDPSRPAFIFYTSGSTGVPKGVTLSHRALLSGQQWLQRTFDLQPGDRHLLRTSLSVTNLIREVFWPMLSGGTIVIVPPGAHKDPDAIVDLITRFDVATLLVVPALLAGLLDCPAFADNRSLKHVFSSSDAMPGDLPERYFRDGPDAPLYNLYGLTEALYASHWHCRPGARYDGFVPIGHPAELDPIVLDNQLAPVADGTVGELCLAGVGLATCYHDDPELTAEKFVSASCGRVYRTGDLARRGADGGLELLGRIDDQIKISGHRVELGEVESRLRSAPHVRDAVVVGQRGHAGHQILVAYLTSDEPELLAAQAIRSHMAHNVPDYMIPVAFTVIADIPETHNGKVDRRALGMLDGERLELVEGYAEPVGERERFLSELWAEMLSIPRVGRHDNFFAIGGDSIQGFLISAKATRAGMPASATQVFETPTVAQMARALDGPAAPVKDMLARSVEAGDAPSTALVAELGRLGRDDASIETTYPLTDMQKGMLFHSLLDPSSGVYFEQFVYALEGQVDHELYARAWQGVVDRHEILRVWIAFRGLDDPQQIVQNQATLEWTLLDWTDRDPAAQAVALETFLREDRRRGFPYEQAPLFRLALIQLTDQDFKLVMSYHHLILDAWSLFVLLRDSLELYSADASRTTTLSQPRSFGQYVDMLGRADAEAAHAYWKLRLADLTSPTIIGNASKLGLSASSLELHSEVRLDIGKDLTDDLRAYGRKHRLTVNSLVQGAWALVLAKLSGQRDVCFGITITHRPIALEGVEDMVGIFINTLPMRLVVQAEPSVDEWLQHVQRTQVAARAHEHYPLPLIQQSSQLPSDEPLFETLLIFENFPRGSGWTGRGGVNVRQDRYIGWTNYPFAIEAMPEDELFFHVKYDQAFFDAERVDHVLQTFREMLTVVAHRGTTRLSEIVQPAAATCVESPASDRLPTRGHTARPAGSVLTRPQGSAEIALESIWATVFETDAVDVDTRFLSLGGNSLRAMRILARAQEAGFEFELQQLFGSQSTIRSLARHVG